MAGWSYVVGRLPRGDLVYRCYLSFYKDSFYWEGSLEWWRQNFRLRVIPRGEKDDTYWDGDLRGFRAAYVPPMPAGAGFRGGGGFGGLRLRGAFGGFLRGAWGAAVSEGFTAERLGVELEVEKLAGLRVHGAGGGELAGAELPVVKERGRYLRVGRWLAWHRVAGVLEGGRWVILGDDGLYEAEFVATAKNPLEDFGEVGFVKVLAPYGGSEQDVASPCGAPRLVACNEEGLRVAGAVLDYVRRALREAGVEGVDLFVPSSWRCARPFVIPELVEVDVPDEAILHWPLADPCPHVLKVAAGDPLGLTTPATCFMCWEW